MTESALQIPHLTQTVDGLVSQGFILGEDIRLARASSITRVARAGDAWWGRRGGAHQVTAGIGWRGSQGRCRRSTL